MERGQRSAVLLTLLEQLQTHGSWCGETHVQKSAYFAQELLGIPLGFDLILYKHGPFSFELSDELTALQADGLLTEKVRDPRYGPSLLPGPVSEQFLGRFPKTRQRFSPIIQFVAERLARKNVTELERLATALYVKRKHPGVSSQPQLAEAIQSLKPHVSFDDALAALQVVDGMTEDAKALGER
jgi:uncharacterized protein YwgA